MPDDAAAAAHAAECEAEEALCRQGLAQGMRLLLAGAADGAAVFERWLRKAGELDYPVGLNLAMLEGAGLVSEAARFRQVAARCGANVAQTIARSPVDAEAAVAEYEALFASGAINSGMISDYLVRLTHLGRDDLVWATFDPGHLLRCVRLDLPAAGGRKSGLAIAMEQLLLRSEGGGRFQEAEESVRNMIMLPMVHRLSDPDAAELMRALHDQVRLYLEHWRTGDHPFARFVPTAFEVEAWGLISRGDGFNTPHLHPRGWATGIYYPTSITGEDAGGELRIGAPASLGPHPPGWPDITIRPEAGLLVLMPSFYLHWTTRLRRPGLRTSIAFDVLPREWN